MCGRFTLTVDPGQIQDAFPGIEVPRDLPPRFNIAPTQPVAVIPNDGKNHLDFYLWGLIPSWAKDPEIGNRMINARAETLAEKPSFRAAFRRRRCLVLADGFYEWRSDPKTKGKTPIYIQLESKEPFGLAGLWEIWTSGDGSEIRSCTIITTEPNQLLTSIHNRMPVIISPKSYERWLSPQELPPEQLQPLLVPYPAEEMVAFPVSRLVNSPNNDVPECVLPIAEI
jgi:putative SOS response-associated peptidase YedK